MIKEQFIEKWGDSVSIEFEFDSNGEFIGSGYNEEKEKQFISDLNSLFNLRTEEEVRERLEEFYFEMGEDYNLWDEEEKGAYPVQRIFDAMKKFIDTEKLLLPKKEINP